MQNLLHSLVKLVVALFFVLIGTIGLFIPWSVVLRTNLVQFLLEDSSNVQSDSQIIEDSLAISLFGFTFIVLGIFVIANIIINSRIKRYVMKGEGGLTEIDESVIHEYIVTYLKQQFPSRDIPVQINIKNNQIYLFIEFPTHPRDEQQKLLEKVKDDLSKLLSSKLGYRNDFRLSASFRS